MTPLAAAALFALAMSLPAPAVHAQTIDIRDCPLDTVVFAEPWSGASFAVKRVGNNHTWICEEGFEPPSELCSGPFGDLVLEGEYRRSEHSEMEQMTAIWSVIKGSPCCSWNVEPGTSAVTRGPDFKWLRPGEAPLLRDMPFLSIWSDYGRDFGNPVHAAACVLRAEKAG